MQHLRVESTSPTFDDIFSAGGEMGALMRTIDWSKTPVGPVQSWPRCLRSSLQILLECRLPMLIAWGPDLIQFYNDAFRPILGTQKHPHAMGKSTPESWKEIWSTVGPMWEEVLAGKSVGFDDFKFIIERSGYPEECYFNFSYSPIRDDDGFVRGVLVTCTETTPKVLSDRRLREDRERLHSLFMQAPVPICILEGPDHVYTLANPPSLALVGNRDVVGMPVRKALPELQGQGIIEILDEVYRTGRPYIGVLQMAFEQANKTLRDCHFDLIYQPWLGLNGQVQGIFLIANEVTAQVAARKKAENAARTRDQFLSIASHELKTPLTTLRLQTHLRKRHIAKGQTAAFWSENMTKMIENDERQLNRLTRLIDDMLDISKISSGNLTINPEEVDLAALVLEVTRRFVDQEHTDCELKVETNNSVTGQWDRYRLEQVVFSLLSTAASQGNGNPIQVSLEAQESHAVLKIQNHGIGPSSEKQSMELYIVSQVIDAHRGSIRVENPSGKGATFVVELPLHK